MMVSAESSLFKSSVTISILHSMNFGMLQKNIEAPCGKRNTIGEWELENLIEYPIMYSYLTFYSFIYPREVLNEGN